MPLLLIIEKQYTSLSYELAIHLTGQSCMQRKALGINEQKLNCRIDFFSLFFSGIPVLALTQTADKQTKEVIVLSLLLKANTCNLFICPNWLNLRINVVKTTEKEALA